MQLIKKQHANLAKGLAIATSTLLANTTLAADGDWKVDSALMFYNEGDNRVQAVEPIINFSKTYKDESEINIHLLADTLTGASPNGAAPANKVQTFTSASSISSSESNTQTVTSASRTRSSQSENDSEYEPSTYTIAPGELPSDPNFKDTRLSAGFGMVKPLNDTLTFNYGGNLSHEEDFMSVSVNSAISKEFNRKNTTLSGGLNLEYDQINPYGGAPLAFSHYSDTQTDGSDKNKHAVDLIAGITQVLSRRWLAKLNVSLSAVSGYQNDPYKIITVADMGNLMEDPHNADSFLYLYENRPDSRTKSSIFLQNKIALFNSDALDMSYRYMTDDWGIHSQTVDMNYHWQISERSYIEPHYRYYQQSAADFYTPFLVNGQQVSVTEDDVNLEIANASSDPRLASFSATTVGIKWGYQLHDGGEFSIRFESYQQNDTNTAVDVPVDSDLYGNQMFAPLTASWLQIGYSLRW